MGKGINERSSQTRNSNQMETSTSTNQSHQQEHPPPAEDTVLLNSEHSIENLLELINKQEEKINALTTRVAFLEQAMQESQSSTIIATNTSKLLSKEIEQLKQYSRHSCLMISGLSFAKNKSSKTTAKTTNSVKDILINQLEIDPDKFNMELDKVHKLPLSSTKKTQHRETVLNVICCFKTHSFREKLYAK